MAIVIYEIIIRVVCASAKTTHIIIIIYVFFLSSGNFDRGAQKSRHFFCFLFFSYPGACQRDKSVGVLGEGPATAADIVRRYFVLLYERRTYKDGRARLNARGHSNPAGDDRRRAHRVHNNIIPIILLYYASYAFSRRIK